MAVFFLVYSMYDSLQKLFLIKNNNNELQKYTTLRGGIPLRPRSARRRPKRKKQIGLRVLQSGMAISVLFLYTSQQVGDTYGGFEATAQTSSTINFCEVFPGSIKVLLTEFKTHVQSALALKESLQSYSLSSGFSDVSGIDSMSLEELDAASEQISQQIAALHSQINDINELLTTNSQIWNEINQELNAAAAILVQIGGYMTSIDSNCLEIKDEPFFRELQSSMYQSGVISESLNASLNGVISYLTSIHNSLPFTSAVTSDVYGQMSLREEGNFEQPFPFLITFNQPSGSISSELTSTYESLTTEMNGLNESASTEISHLQNQLQWINQTRDKQLEELEKARLKALEEAKKEEERLALEKLQQQEAEDKAKAEASPPPSDQTATEAPNQEQPEPPATDPSQPENVDELTIPTDVPQQEAPQEMPKVEATTPDPPEAAQAPTDPQQAKGGE